VVDDEEAGNKALTIMQAYAGGWSACLRIRTGLSAATPFYRYTVSL